MHATLVKLATGPEVAKPQAEALAPTVPIRKSITPDFLVCLDDGKRFKSLRHPVNGLGLTPSNIARNGGCHPIIPWSRRTTRPSGRSWRSRSESDKFRRDPGPRPVGIEGGRTLIQAARPIARR
jgi:hypothetical protein